MAMEIEAKIRVADLTPIAERLRALGASGTGEAVLERNWVLDRPDNGLRNEGVVLRVRNTGGAGGVLTTKGPARDGRFKTREEIETTTDSTAELLRQLALIGFRVAWRYEKRRATWLWRDCVLALDECPEIGAFVEIEGTPDNIPLVAADIGLDSGEHLQDSYLTLWQKHLAGLGQPPRDMIFP